jgi:hypothetical protein
MIEKFQTLEVRGRKSSKPWKFLLCLFPIIGSLAMAQGPGSQVGFFQAWYGVPVIPLDYFYYWKINEGTGTNSFEASGGPLINWNNSEWVSAGNSFAKSITNASGSGRTSSSITYNTNVLTLSAMVFINDTNTAIIVESSPNFNNISYSFILSAEPPNNSGFRFRCTVRVTPAYGIKTSSDLPTNNWYHVVAVYDMSAASSNSLFLYVNAVKNETYSFFGSNPSATTNSFTAQTLYFGARNTSQFPINGAISEVFLYKRKLEEYEITQLYNYSRF